MANLSSNRAVSDSRNIDTNLQSSKYLNYSKLSNPNVDKNNIYSPSNLSDNLKSNNFKIYIRIYMEYSTKPMNF